MFGKSQFVRFIGLLAILALALTACLPATPLMGGIVQGAVYGDLNGDGSFRNSPGDATLTFANASTQTFDPGGAYSTDCGDNTIKALVTSLNAMNGQASWTVVQL